MIHRNPQHIDDAYFSSRTELEALADRQGLSSYLDVSNLLTKSFLVSCASHYETIITDTVKDFVSSTCRSDSVASWIISHNVEGKFFSWFNFRSDKNINKFLKLWGDDYK